MASAHITAPDKRTAMVVGVEFHDGEGSTADPRRIAFFERIGWKVERDAATDDAATDDAATTSEDTEAKPGKPVTKPSGKAAAAKPPLAG